MRERVEFRIPEENARDVLGPQDGAVLGDSVRKMELAMSDARVELIRDADAEYRGRGASFFTSWNITRHYSESELDEAELLHLSFTRMFEPAGEECGTRYSQADTCPTCGAGDKQIGYLRLDVRKLPKRVDMARSIADEWVVSQRLSEALLASGLTGFALQPVLHRNAPLESVDLRTVPAGRRLLEAAESEGIDHDSGEYWVWLNKSENRAAFLDALAESELLSRAGRRPPTNLPVWHQLQVTAPAVPVAPSTRFGSDLFDEDPEGLYRCPLGHVAGLNLLSEIYVLRADRPTTDFAITCEQVGDRRGLLRPTPLLLVSQRTRAALNDHGLKGHQFEVAHLLDG